MRLTVILCSSSFKEISLLGPARLFQGRAQEFRIQEGQILPEGGFSGKGPFAVLIEGQGFFQKLQGPIVGRNAGAVAALDQRFFKAPEKGAVGLATGAEIAVEGVMEKAPAGVEEAAPGQENFQRGAFNQKALARKALSRL
jgi:hypothetical protein